MPMALCNAAQIHSLLHLDQELALDVASSLNLTQATRQVRNLVTKGEYDRIAENKGPGDDEYDRIVQAEVLFAFAAFIGNRGGIRLSQKGGLVRDFGLIDQGDTIRQLLTQGQIEEVQGRLRSQAKTVLDDLIDSSGQVWAI